jgi:hypothetical protein
MDIVNWDALKKGLLIKDTLESTNDLVLVAANTSYNKRGDLYQTYAVPASALGGGGGGGITQLTGDVTAGPGAGSVIATISNLAVSTGKIANNAVTFGKMQTLAGSTFLGNPLAGVNPVQAIALSTVPFFSGGIGGAASNSTFLRGDGQWVTPPVGTVTANSGLTKTADNIQLGGELVKVGETLIGTTDVASPNRLNSLAVSSYSATSSLGVSNSAGSGSAISATHFGTGGGVAAIFNSRNNSGAGQGTVEIGRSVTNFQNIYSVISMTRNGNTSNAIDGYGMQFRQQLGTTAGTTQNAAFFNTSWSTAANATRTAQYQILLANNGSEPTANITFRGNGNINLAKTLPTAATGLVAGDLYTQTATELGGSGAQKVICIV